MKTHQNAANTPWGRVLQWSPIGKSSKDFTKGWPKACSDLTQEQRQDVSARIQDTRERLEAAETIGPHMVVGFGRQTAVLPLPLDAERDDRQIERVLELASMSDPDYVLLIACGWNDEANSTGNGGLPKGLWGLFKTDPRRYYGVMFSLKTKKGGAHAKAELLKTQAGTRGYQFSAVKNWTSDPVAGGINLAALTAAIRMCAH